MKLVSGKILLALIIIFSVSCTRDQISEVESECGEEVSYEEQIKPIIDISCAYAGCHGGGAPGNFSTYDGISDYIGGKLIGRRVLIERSMPPNYAIIGPVRLSDEELELFQCWVQAGYPEN